MREPVRRPRPLLRAVIGDVLRRTRLEQGRTLADVARAARVSLAYLSELERGRKEASSEVLAAICDALRIELPGLLAEAGRQLVASRPGHAPVSRQEVRISRPEVRISRPEAPVVPPQDPATARDTVVIRLAGPGLRSPAPQAGSSGDVVALLAA